MGRPAAATAAMGRREPLDSISSTAAAAERPLTAAQTREPGDATECARPITAGDSARRGAL